MKTYIIQSRQAIGYTRDVINLFVLNAEDDMAVEKVCARVRELIDDSFRKENKSVKDSFANSELSFLANDEFVTWIYSHLSVGYEELPLYIRAGEGGK